MGAYDYILGAQGVQLPDPVKTAQQTMSLAQAADARRVTQFTLEKMMRDDAAAKGLGDAIPGIKNPDDDQEVLRVIASAPPEARAGIAKFVTDQRKARADAAKDQATAGKTNWEVKREQAGTVAGIANYFLSKPEVTQQDIDAAGANLKRLNLDPGMILPPPGVDPKAHWQALAAQAVSVKDQVEQAATAARDKETQRYHTNQNALAEGHLSEEARSHRANEGNAAARLALERSNANQGTLSAAGVDANGNPVLFNNKSGALSSAGAGGAQPYSGPVMDRGAYDKRAAIVSAADNADKLLQKVEANPRAFSDIAALSSNAPAFIGSRLQTRTMTPEDREARATILRESAIELNRLYGAAQSAGEAKRAQSFIPDGNDDLSTVLIKLKAARDWGREAAIGGVPGSGSASKSASAGQVVDKLPDPASVKPGTRIRDTKTGEILTSDGKSWR
jgi:hypothetical protein